MKAISKILFIYLFTMWTIPATGQLQPTDADVCLSLGYKTGTNELVKCVISMRTNRDNVKSQSQNPVDICLAMGHKGGSDALSQCVILKTNEISSPPAETTLTSTLPDCPSSWTNETWSGCFGRKMDVNGRTYVGEFNGNMREGLGIRYRVDGSIEVSGRWKWGDLITPLALNPEKFSKNPDSPTVKSVMENDAPKSIAGSSSQIAEQTKYLAEICISMGLRGGTTEFSNCVIKLKNVVPFEKSSANPSKDDRSKKEAELMQQEAIRRDAFINETRRIQELEQLRRERESSQSQTQLINEILRAQESEKNISTAIKLLEIGRPQPLPTPQVIPPPIGAPTVCNSRWNPVIRAVQTICN